MFTINVYSHIPFLRKELRKLIPNGSFAELMFKKIGNELVPFGNISFFEDEEYAGLFPLEYLFKQIQKGSKDEDLDLFEWIAEEDGTYVDDHGNLIPSTVEVSLTGVQKLAIYGLYLITNYLEALDVVDPSTGKAPVDRFGCQIEQTFEFEGRNAHGNSEVDVTSHKAECLLQAYKALSYANSILAENQNSTDEKNIDSSYFSMIGKKGSDKRNMPRRQLRTIALDLYKKGQWSSANQAAYQLKDRIIDEGKKLGLNIIEQNAQRTIAEWFRKYS